MFPNRSWPGVVRCQGQSWASELLELGQQVACPTIQILHRITGVDAQHGCCSRHQLGQPDSPFVTDRRGIVPRFLPDHRLKQGRPLLRGQPGGRNSRMVLIPCRRRQNAWQRSGIFTKAPRTRHQIGPTRARCRQQVHAVGICLDRLRFGRDNQLSARIVTEDRLGAAVLASDAACIVAKADYVGCRSNRQQECCCTNESRTCCISPVPGGSADECAFPQPRGCEGL